MKIKKVIYIVVLIVLIVGFLALLSKPKMEKVQKNDKISIVCTSFIGYDFSRAIVGDASNIEITYLMDPGVDAHTFEPTANQLITIQNADLFIYNGGEMENWTEKVIPTLDLKETKLFKIMDSVELLEEEHEEEEEHDHENEELEWDEHVWTSPENAIIIVKKIAEAICEIEPKEKNVYENNAVIYMNQIKKLDNEFLKIIENSNKKRLVFGDRMPIRYFLKEFGLQAKGAFNGCSTETEPSTKTLTNLIDIVKQEEISTILYIENGNSKIASIIAEETGAEVMQIQTLHTVSKSDFDNGENYVSLMSRNLDVLEKALN